MNKILIPAILSSYGPRADKSWRLTINVNEPNAEQKVIIDKMHQQAIYVLLKEGEITKEEQGVLDSIGGEVKSKSKSQTLRAVLYRNWEKDKKGFTDFEKYYEAEMERIITHYKDKLN